MLAELAGRLFRDAFAAENTPEDMRAYLAAHFTEAALRRVLDDPAFHALVLEDGGTPVGWALLVSGPAPRGPDLGGQPLAPGGEVEIRRFYVDARLHGGDAGPTLLGSTASAGWGPRASASARTPRPTRCCSVRCRST